MSRRHTQIKTGRSAAIPSELISLDLAPSESGGAADLHTVLLIYAGIEFLAVACTAYFASMIYHLAIFGAVNNVAEYLAAALTIATLVLLISAVLQNFTSIQRQPRHVFLRKGLGTVTLAFPIFLTVLFSVHFAETYSRATFIIQIFCVGFTVTTSRMLLYSWLQYAVASRKIEARRVFLISDAPHSSELIERLRASGILTVGLFNAEGVEGEKIPDSILRALITQLRSLRIDDIIEMTNTRNLSSMLALASDLSELPVGVHLVPVDAADFLSTADISEFGNLRTVQLYRRPLSATELVIKRAFDIIAATAGLILLSPLFFIVSIAIKLDSAGPIFYQQRRHGFNNEIIRVFKFRSMIATKDENQFLQTVEGDPRVTRVGRIIRRTNIDELPQLINVLLGNMSIVGPRPHATAHNEAFDTMIKPFSRRHTVQPGITGWAQVNGYRGATDTLEKMRRRVEYDLYYVDHWSFLLDLKIIMMTLFSKAAYTNAY